MLTRTLTVLSPTAPDSFALPCQSADAELFFAEQPERLAQAQSLCHSCPLREQCYQGAVTRGEPWGVWGGRIFENGRVIATKRGRGRPRKAA